MILQKIPVRMVLYPRDVINIMGCSRTTAYRLIKKIRQANGKKNLGFVTLQEFCSFCEMNEEHVIKYL
jgi:transposase-like protein